MASVESPQPNQKRTLIRGLRRRPGTKFSPAHWAKFRLQEQASIDSGVAPEVRMELLKQHGDFSLAYSTAVQPCLQHFGDHHGYITHRNRFGVTIALGDPMTSEEHRDSLLQRFVERFERPVFCQISLPTAVSLSNMGYYVNEFGVDTTLDLENYSLAGKHKEWLRYAFNWVQRRGYRVEESDFDRVDVAQVESVSEAWRATRTVKRKEVRFLNRPIILDVEPEVRRFFLFDPLDNVQAYVFFDPLYSNGLTTGYVTTFKRRHPDAPLYAEHAIMKVAIETLKAEGVGKIQLGLSPCAWIDDAQFRHSWFTSKAFQTLFRSRVSNRWAYNLAGHARYKRRFRGDEEKVYFASRTFFSLRQLMSLIGLCGIA